MTEEKKIVEINKPYKFRDLNSTDVFTMARLVSKIGIKNFESIFDAEGFNDIVNGEHTEDDYIKVGAKAILGVADTIIERLCDCEKEIYEVLEKTSNLTLKQIQELKPNIFINMIYDFVNKEEIPDFFNAVLQFVQ